MRRTIVLAALGLTALTGLPAVAIGQVARNEFIVNIGFSRSNFGGSDEAGDLQSRSGFFFGAGFGRTFENRLGIRLEVDYDSKGAELPPDEESRFGVQTQYVDVPLLVRYTLGEGENYNMRPALFAGPSVGFEVGCKTQTLASSGFYDEVDCGETNPRKKTVFDFVAGAELGIQSFVIGLRYTYGFTDLLTAAEAPTLKNRMWALSLGYTF
jgi:hypothetical protein